LCIFKLVLLNLLSHSSSTQITQPLIFYSNYSVTHFPFLLIYILSVGIYWVSTQFLTTDSSAGWGLWVCRVCVCVCVYAVGIHWKYVCKPSWFGDFFNKLWFRSPRAWNKFHYLNGKELYLLCSLNRVPIRKQISVNLIEWHLIKVQLKWLRFEG